MGFAVMIQSIWSAPCLMCQGRSCMHIARESMWECRMYSTAQPGSRSIMGMMREDGLMIGRFKVSRLMT
jgi:hypothetical protein